MANIDVDKKIKNVDELIAEVGDLTTGKVSDIITDYIAIATEWNTFLDTCIAEVDVHTTTPFSGTTEQEKIDYLKEKTFYGDSEGFLTKLREGVNDRDLKRAQIKERAEEVLKKQYDLIQENKEVIKELNEQLGKDSDKKDELNKEIKEKENEIKAIEAKITKRDTLISDLRAEIIELDKEHDLIKEKQAEIVKYTNEKKDFNDKISNRETLINSLRAEINTLNSSADNRNLKMAKQAEITKYIDEKKDFNDKVEDIKSEVESKKAEESSIDIAGRRTKIDDLEKKNKDLQKNLDDRFKDLDDKLSKDDIIIENPANKKQTQQQDQSKGQNGNNPPNQGDSNAQQNGKNNSKGGNGQVSQNPPEQNKSENETSLVKLTDKQIAKNMCREFRTAKTLEEQRKMVDGYGYSDLVAMMPYLGILDRKRMKNIVTAMRDDSQIPKEAEFEAKITAMTGDATLGKQWYDLLFCNGEAKDFKSMTPEELRSIQGVIDTINDSRSEIAKKDSELLKYFDENFAEFVKNGSLLERVKTGRFKEVIGDLFRGKQKVARDRLSGSMRDYTMAKQDEMYKKAVYDNSIREALGQEVNPLPDVENSNRSNTRYTSRLQDLDNRNSR